MKKYSDMTKALAVAKMITKGTRINRKLILANQRKATEQHEAAVAHLPADKPAKTYTPPVDSAKRKVVNKLGHRCAGFQKFGFSNH
jgi:hypothetical protein